MYTYSGISKSSMTDRLESVGCRGEEMSLVRQRVIISWQACGKSSGCISLFPHSDVWHPTDVRVHSELSLMSINHLE